MPYQFTVILKHAGMALCQYVTYVTYLRRQHNARKDYIFMYNSHLYNSFCII